MNPEAKSLEKINGNERHKKLDYFFIRVICEVKKGSKSSGEDESREYSLVKINGNERHKKLDFFFTCVYT